MNEIRVSFDEKDFEELVSGKIVEKEIWGGRVVKIALQDIGYDLMFEIMDKKYEEFLKQQQNQH